MDIVCICNEALDTISKKKVQTTGMTVRLQNAFHHHFTRGGEQVQAGLNAVF